MCIMHHWLKINGFIESTALGACKVAMIGSGVDLSEISDQNLSTFRPNKDLKEQYLFNHKSWKKYILDSLKN